MLENNYQKVYVALFLNQATFSSYKKDESFVINFNNNEIIVTENSCYLNGVEYSVDELLSMIK